MANPGSYRSRLAAAHQTMATLRNRLHAIEQEVTLPLRQRIAELERDKGTLTDRMNRAEARVGRLSTLCAAYEQAVDAFVRLAAERLASGKEHPRS